LSSGISIFFASSSAWARGPFPAASGGDAVELVDRLDHVHRDADGARLVGDRAGDRLADPPGGVGRELVAAAVFELVDRLHQADVAFLDQVEELQAAVGVLLGDGDDQAQVGLDHFLLGLARLGLAVGHRAVDFLDVAQRQEQRLLDADQLFLLADDLVLELAHAARPLLLATDDLVGPGRCWSRCPARRG
jgi:hypothetical protein